MHYFPSHMYQETLCGYSGDGDIIAHTRPHQGPKQSIDSRSHIGV